MPVRAATVAETPGAVNIINRSGGSDVRARLVRGRHSVMIARVVEGVAK